MPTTEKLRKKLMTKLTELFQLDQPDLDFGFYRIMQAKAQQVKSFIDKDLLQIIEDAFGQVDEGRRAELADDYENVVREALEEYGVAEPEKTPKALKAKAALDALLDGATAESDVYDHLYRFFERYYDEGDFISRRYYARENSGKAAPFAIPYNGEEVKLHWANADQYYIKTAEYFSNYSFDITQAAEIRKMSNAEKVLNGIPEKTLKVHFRIVDASEGEHGNVKASEDKKRFFILHEENPVEFNDADELVINFEYKALPGGKNDVDADTEKALKEKFSKSLNKGDMPNLAIAEKVIKALSVHEKEENNKENVRDFSAFRGSEYLTTLQFAAPTDKISNRPLLAKYINQYTARNTCDYFIHKDLSGFLKRELDFYIKNEVMHLDDIENADAPAVENYLARLKVIRKIATKLIDFLAQLEDFQKKLWLKKKFVTETNYCITLDRVPEELYEEIAVNQSQFDEWMKLGFLEPRIGTNGHENEPDLFKPQMDTDEHKLDIKNICENPCKSVVNFLKANDKLVLDTAFFSPDFKARLIASIEDFDDQCDGLLIHSENFQALNLLQERYREQVKCVYIDPPYNTAASEILYKNEYKHSSWCTLMNDRISSSKELLSSTGIIEIAIDDAEFFRLEGLTRNIFGDTNYIGNIAIMHNPKGRDQEHIADCHEYTLLACKDSRFSETYRLKLTEDELAKKYAKGDGDSRHRELPLRRSGSGARREDRQKMYFPFIYKFDSQELDVIPENEYQKIWDGKKFDDCFVDSLKKKYESLGYHFILPVRDNGFLGRWRWGYETSAKGCKNGSLFCKIKGPPTIYEIDEADDTFLPKTLWYGERYDASTKGTNLLKSILPENNFDYPKSIFAVEDMIKIASNEGDIVLDFFGGSGTTAHAVINHNRRSEPFRKWMICEMGDHFVNVTKPRITKVIYSSDWKNGKPVPMDNSEFSTIHSPFNGISHCFKYIRLESYEDTLNNLVFDSHSADSSIRKNAETREKVISGNPSLKEDYMLRYLLNVETRGSQSLLNIDAFADPCAYSLVVKKTGSDEQVTQNIDLIETFNYLLGLRLENMAAPQTFTASFTRKHDPKLPEDKLTKLVVHGKIQPITNQQSKISDPTWWFRKLEGWVPADPMNPNNGRKERVLIVWRKLTGNLETGNLEEDNLMLDEWFKKYCIPTRDFEYNTIYVNGSNNLPNLKKDNENWKVRLIEEEFHKKMWEIGE